MRRIVLGLAWVLVALTVMFMGGAYVWPGEAKVDRRIVIEAPVAAVWPLVSDLRRFQTFSPWADLDPSARYVMEGPETGVGQKMTWSSKNAAVGQGSQTITAVVPNERVETELDFGAMGKATVRFDLIPVGEGTQVIWSFQTPLRNPLERWLGLLYDRWIGPDYEKGLARLKAAAEKR